MLYSIAIVQQITCKSITVHCNDIITSYCFIDDYFNCSSENSLHIINPNRHERKIETMLEIRPTKRSNLSSIESIFRINFPALEKLFISNSLNEMPSFQFLSSSLKYINFRENHIKHVPPFSIEGAGLLEVINLNRNLIQSIDDFAFSNLKNLHTINAEENELTLISNMTFAGANSLRVINLRRNHITTLMDGCFAVKTLEELNLANNQIVILDDLVFDGAIKLKKVTFAHNRIRSIDLNAIATSSSPIERLNLADNQIGLFENVSINCANAVNIKMKHLNFAENQLSSSNIFWNLKCFQHLETLNLNKNNFTQFENVIDLKVYFTHLTIIYLIDNHIKCEFLERTIFDTSLIYTMTGHKHHIKRIACTNDVS